MRHVAVWPLLCALQCGTALIARTSLAAVASPPNEALAFPAETQALAALDVRRFLASPLHGSGADPVSTMTTRVLKDLRGRFGLDVDRDVDRLFLALGEWRGPEPHLLLLLGRFDGARIERTLRTGRRQPTITKISGNRALVLNDPGKSAAATAVCVLNPQTILIGTLPLVEQTLAARVAGRRPLLANTLLARLIKHARPDVDFWIAAESAQIKKLSAGADASKASPAPAIPALDLAQLRGVVLTGLLADTANLTLVGETTDETAARSTALMVRGLLALAAMNARRPDWKLFAGSIETMTEGPLVRLQGRFPYALLQRLAVPAPKATRTPQGGSGTPIR